MALKLSPTPLVIALVQGANDAFVQGQVATGLSGRQAYALKGIAIESLQAVTLTDTAEVEIAITRRSKAAMPNISDIDVLMKFRWQGRLTTSGAGWRDKVIYWKPENEIPLVEDTIYAQLDSNATAAIQSVVVRLDVDLDTISDIDRLNLIARSLA